MSNLRKRLADEICRFESYVKPSNWFAEEVCDLACKYGGLDEMPLKAMIPLARLSTEGTLDTSALSRVSSMETSEVEECIDALLANELVRGVTAGYEATDSGKEAFAALGEKWVIRLRFEYQGRLSNLESLHMELRK